MSRSPGFPVVIAAVVVASVVIVAVVMVDATVDFGVVVVSSK